MSSHAEPDHLIREISHHVILISSTMKVGRGTFHKPMNAVNYFSSCRDPASPESAYRMRLLAVSSVDFFLPIYTHQQSSRHRWPFQTLFVEKRPHVLSPIPRKEKRSNFPGQS